MSLEPLLLSWYPSGARTHHAPVDVMNEIPLSQPTLSLSPAAPVVAAVLGGGGRLGCEGDSLLFTQPPNADPRETALYWQPTGPNPLYHRDDQVDRPRAMGV